MLSDKPWKLEAVLRLLMGIFVSMFLGLLLLQWLLKQQMVSDSSDFLKLVAGTLSFHGMALLLTHLFLRQHQMTWKEAFGLSAGPLRRVVGAAVLVGVGVLPIVWTLGQLSALLMELAGHKAVPQEPVQMLQAGIPIAIKAFIGVLAIVVAPLAEEVIFRGVVYPALKQQGYPRLALWGTSILFAAIHGNLMLFLPLTLLAVVLTVLYEATDNLLAPIISHSVFNFVNYFWLIAAPMAG